MRLHRFIAVLAGCCALSVGVAACGDDDDTDSGGSSGSDSAQGLSGSIRIDGSSTVQPLAEAAVEGINAESPDLKVSVGGIGTGDGFQRFCRGELDIANASRAIEKDDIADQCESGQIKPVQVQVGIDGLSVVTHKDLAIPNDCITTDQLKELLEPKSKVSNYKELGSGFPDQKVSFFTPGTESGTYDYFTEEVLETEAEQRTKDVQTSADDNQIVTGITGTEGALGYVGFAFADQQKDKLKILAVDGGDGCVKPEIDTIANNKYAPLSRPLFMYPSTESVAKPEVKGFIQYVLDNNEQVNTAADYVALTPELLDKAKADLTAAKAIATPTE